MDVGERDHRLVEEHDAELAHDCVVRAGADVVDLHVGNAERHIVDAGSGWGDGLRGCDGRLAAAATDVEHPFAGPQCERVEEKRSDRVGESLPLGPDLYPVVVVPALALSLVLLRG